MTRDRLIALAAGGLCHGLFALAGLAMLVGRGTA